MNICNIKLNLHKKTNKFIQYNVLCNKNNVSYYFKSAKIINFDKKNIFIDISNNDNLLKIFNKLDKHYYNNSIYTKSKYDIIYDNIVKDNIIKIIITNNTSIIYNNKKIKLNDLSIGDIIDGRIQLYCYYVKPSNKKAGFLLKTHDVIKNTIYINSDSIDLVSDNEKIEISKLNELLYNTESNNTINKLEINSTETQNNSSSIKKIKELIEN